MKRRSIVILAVILIALGAVTDRVLTLTLDQPAAAAAKSVAQVSTAPSRQPAATSSASTSTAVTSSAIDQAFEHAYAVAGASVVYVDNVGTGTGSGVIYDARGDIVTNNHVVSGAKTLKVTLNDGRVFSAQIVGIDPADDLAVIRIQASNIKPAHFASGGTYHVAQTVLAIGSPLGLKQSVTFGLISGLGRVEQEPDGAYLPNAIQTSAPINPGNSGGALVTLNGVVVGMPTLEQTSAQDGTSAQAIGFAVPSTRITSIADQIIATGKVQHTGRPYLGISPADPSRGSASPFGGGFGPGFFGQGGYGQGGSSQTPTAGAVVQQISSSGPAAKAGVQQGDTITAVNGTSISNAEDLLTILAQKKPGQTVTLTIHRNGSTLTVHVRLGELPG
jgi:putative serine protease PepD